MTPVIEIVEMLRENYRANPEYPMPSEIELWRLARKIKAEANEFYGQFPGSVVAS